MSRLSVMQWLMIVFGGVVVGFILVAMLPKPAPFAPMGYPGGPMTRNFPGQPYPGPIMRRGGLPGRPVPMPSQPMPGTIMPIAPKPPLTQYTPWILIIGGAGFAVAFRNNANLVTIGGAVVTAGVTALLGTS